MDIHLWGLRRSGIHMVGNYLAALTDAVIHNNTNPQAILQAEQAAKQVLPSALSRILIYEDQDLAAAEQIALHNWCAKAIGVADAAIHVVIIRDPANLAASRIKHYDAISSEGRWINKAIAIGNYQQYVSAAHGRQLGGKTLCVCYNRFVGDVAARMTITEQIAEMITLAPRARQKAENTLRKIDKNGNGSTWDGRAVPPAQMDVTGRYRYYAHLPAFRALFSSGFLRECEKYFGLTYEGL